MHGAIACLQIDATVQVPGTVAAANDLDELPPEVQKEFDAMVAAWTPGTLRMISSDEDYDNVPIDFQALSVLFEEVCADDWSIAIACITHAHTVFQLSKLFTCILLDSRWVLGVQLPRQQLWVVGRLLVSMANLVA